MRQYQNKPFKCQNRFLCRRIPLALQTILDIRTDRNHLVPNQNYISDELLTRLFQCSNSWIRNDIGDSWHCFVSLNIPKTNGCLPSSIDRSTFLEMHCWQLTSFLKNMKHDNLLREQTYFVGFGSYWNTGSVDWYLASGSYT